MSRKFPQVLPPEELEQLDVPPHVMAQVMLMMVGDWQPDPAELDQLITHLVQCSACLTAFHNLISMLEKESEAQDSASLALLRKLDGQIERIIEKTQALRARKAVKDSRTPS